MTLLTASLLVLAGLALLAIGGELLVRGATELAQLSGVTPAVIGLTVVALGTSLPELVVSVIAAAKGQPDLAVANVVGSNIANITLILGLTAVIAPLPILGAVVRREWPFLFAITIICMLFVRDGQLSRAESAMFLASLALFIGYMVYLSREEVTAAEERALDEEVRAMVRIFRWQPVIMAIGATVIGIGLLLVGGKLLVDGAVGLAELAGMTPRVIGLTIVAIGTSAPEIATSVVAALRGRTEVAVANLIGSNVFNTLGILGAAGVLVPLPVSAELAGGDMWWMLAATVLIFPIMLVGRRISRWNGMVLLGFYVVYLWTVVGG
jgi:cation:H+ antiporter